MKAYLMTSEEYKKEVSPIIKSYFKFLRKNKKYFAIKKAFYGLEYFTYSEYLNSEIEKGKKKIKENEDKDWVISLYSKDSCVETANKEWERCGGIKENPPKEIINDYKSYITKLQEFFIDITKVEKDEQRSNKRSIRRAINNDLYIEDMLDGKISFDDVEEIIKSVGLKVSKRIKDMKFKIENEGYTRSFENKIISLQNSIDDKIRDFLSPYTEELKSKKEKEVLNIINDYLNSDYNSIYKYLRSKNISKSQFKKISDLLYKFLKNGNKKDNFYDILEKEKENYVEFFISKFIERFNEKISVISYNIGSPEIKFENINFTGQNLKTDGYLLFKNDLKIYFETDTILAGGDVQILHERYLIKFFKDGKKVNLKEIDSIKN